MDPIITNVFPKQPRETRWYPINFGDRLTANNDTARAIAPIEFDTIPAGVTLDDSEFDPQTNMLRILVSGGTDGQRYQLTMWLYTTSGQKLEHQVSIKVKEEAAR